MISNTLNDQSTIAAIATARGAAGVAVIRVSGPDAWRIGRQIFSGRHTAFQPGQFYHGWISDEGHLIDEVLLLVFKGPHSYTGEDVIEIHGHGGEVISHTLLNVCVKNGARLARPGEFTLRAFLNGKMDLTQAESVMDLVSAGSTRMLAQASANLRNRSLGQTIDQVAAQLLELQAQIVAAVDFPDEVDEPEREALRSKLDECLAQMTRLQEGAQRNRLVREGVKVAILGMPNAGKSSLFNTLLATDRSIVTDEAGTTRDVVTETLEVDGIAVTLIDTAGIRDTQQSIEMMGIERSWQAADAAQLVIYMVDATTGLQPYDTQILEKLDPNTTLMVANKNDLANTQTTGENWLSLSTRTGNGMDTLLSVLREKIRAITHEETGMALALNQRQLTCCEAVIEALRHARHALHDPHLPIDLVTVPLTDALRKLDELMGRDTTEEVLTSVFNQFCVGK